MSAKKIIRVVSAEICESGRYLITQRHDSAVLPSLWEFPGGRVLEEETDASALARTLEHRLDVSIKVGKKQLEVTHEYEDWMVVLVVYSCKIMDGELQAKRVADFAWVEPSEFSHYEFPPADARTVRKLLED